MLISDYNPEILLRALRVLRGSKQHEHRPTPPFPRHHPASFAQPRRRSSLTQIATCGQPSLRTRAELFRLTGVDWVAVHGMSASLAQITRRVSDMGTDMSKWPTEQHFASWLGLAPHNDISGGRILRCRTWPTDNRAGQAFRQAAASVTRSLCAFGAYSRRKKARFGPRPALVATAHKIARMVYAMLKQRAQYHDIGAVTYEQKQQERELNALKKKAAKLGFALVPYEPAPVMIPV